MNKRQFCECCRCELAPTDTRGLCGLCASTLDALRAMAPSYQRHALAAALSHSVKEICRRFGCTYTAHKSALTNGAGRWGVSRPLLVKCAGYAIRVGMLERPKGFEDCNPVGWSPEHVTGTGEVTSSQLLIPARPDLAHRPLEHILEALSCRDLGARAGIAHDTANQVKQGNRQLTSTELARLRESLDGIAPQPIQASPATPTAVEAPPQPEAPRELLSFPAEEPPAPSPDFERAHERLLRTKRDLDTCHRALRHAESAYAEACEALKMCGPVA